MELSFNHFKNVQDVDCYLCNPDRSLLSVIPARARNFILRFNTLSEFTCEVPKYVSNAKGDLYEHPYYDYIQTRRLINVDKIGWFKIVEAVETENGNGTSKSVRAESCESTFKEVGFAIENRVYKFYDELDEEDESYNPLNEEAMPSVVGQLYKQLGICCDLSVGDITPTVDYGDWTIIWIEDDLKYSTSKDTNICRTLNENVESFGYDFMTSDVSQAFQVFFEFDFAHHAIKVKSTSKVAEKTDIYLSFDNVMKELSTTENSQDIVTVLTCEGTNLGINSVNPMGTNYICDFSYYMGNKEKGYPWMSQALTDKIEAWKDKVSDNEDSYAELVEKLQELYEKKTALESKKTLIDKEVFVIKKAADDYVANPNTATSPVDVEIVKTGEYSLAANSVFANSAFKDDVEISGGWKVYEKAPIYIDGAYAYKSREGNEYKPLASGDTLSDCFSLIGIPTKDLYFSDGDTQSYCELLQGTTIDKTDPENPNATYFVDGFTRFAPYSRAGIWQSTRENEQRTVDTEIETEQTAIDAKLAEMKAISDECNILSFFSGADNANLLKELRCYWVDGKYTNDTLKGLDGDTVAENLSLSKELMEAGKVELQRVAQPRFTFTVTSANFLKMPQFQKFAQQLEMGRSVTVEKNESTRYEAALTEMSFSLDESDTFSLTFSNSLKLTDWGFTYADLFKSVSDTSRAVQANWTNLMEYSQEKETISNLLINSLDRTLRAGLDNAYNQEFIVDTSGILGRKFKNDNTAYENEQLRIINNVIMFTNDNWQTASAALGKVTYVDPMDSSKSITKYGVVAEAIVGKLLMGENLYIGDGDGYVTINSKGIEILNEAKKTVFKATNDGSLTVSGYATIGDLLEVNKELGEFKVSVESTYATNSELKDLSNQYATLALSLEGFEVTVSQTYMTITTANNTYLSQGDAEENYLTKNDASETYTLQTAFNQTASGFTQSITRIEGDVTTLESEISQCVKTDENGNVETVITITSNILTIDTDYFKLSPDGTIEASGGLIGGLNLNAGEIFSEDGFSLSSLGISFNKESAKLTIGDTVLYCDEDKSTYITASGLLYIKGGDSSYIALNTHSEGEEKEYTANIEVYGTDNKIYVRVKVSDTLLNTTIFRIRWEAMTMNILGTYDHIETGGIDFTIAKGSQYSSWCRMGGDFVDTYYAGLFQANFKNVMDGFNDGDRISLKNLWDCTESIPHVLQSDGSTFAFSQQTSSIIQIQGALHPSETEKYDLGTNDLKWNDIYANSVIQTSDRNKKNSITDLTEIYSQLFDNLRPVVFKFNNGTSGRLHTGFIAQEIEEVMHNIGLSTQDFAALCKKEDDTGYGLRYGEFIALCVNEIQKLKKELKEIRNET